MSPKMELHTKLNITPNGLSFKMKCHLNGMSLRIEMSPKMECHSEFIETQKIVTQN